jgi:DNA-binding NarL/FixJ family response regulator
VRVVLAEDSALLRETLSVALKHAGFDVLGAAKDANALMDLVAEHRPEVAIVDIRMPPTHTEEGIHAAHAIRERFPATAVLVLSQHLQTEYALKVISEGSGKVGYLLKERVSNLETLRGAIQRVAAGEVVVDPEIIRRVLSRKREASPVDELTAREREILGLMAEGHSNGAISERLFLSGRTVETHIAAIFTKLDLRPAPDTHRRVLAVLAYLRR